MIPNVTKGSGMVGLLRYLVGPGKVNEHTDPHLVAGSEMLLVGYGETGHLSRQEATEIAAWIDSPRRMHGVEITVPNYESDPHTGEKRVVGRKVQHVFHCSLSLPPGERLGDERWGRVAEEFATAMGFTGAGKAACRWTAVHHGSSKDGNDHVHFVASMVREDGTVWGGQHYDYADAQKACRALEIRHGLTVVQGPERGIGERGVKPAEAARAQAAGADLTVPQELALQVRAAATAASSEAEFVRRVRGAGVVVKPRYEKGSTTEVVGYSVALPTARTGGKWVPYGGGKLGRDLTLPELRKGWGAAKRETPAEAVAEWGAAHAGTPVVEPTGRETRGLRPSAAGTAAERLAMLNRRLATVPHGDREEWAQAARHGAGALAAVAVRDAGRTPGLANAARVLARSAQSMRPAAAPAPEGAMGAALVALARGGTGVERQLVHELTRTAQAVAARHRSVGNVGEAERIATGVLGPLHALGIATMAGQVTARAARRAVEVEQDYRGWESGGDGERDAGLDR